jgi:hypothetical protein
LNPFNSSQENVLGLSSSFRNSLFYNRGKQKHSVTYSYLKNETKNLLSIGSQDSQNSSHQFNILIYTRKVGCLALCKTIQTDIASENFIEKNYTIKGYQIAQNQLSLSKHQLMFFYELQNKENQIGNFESLVQNRFEPPFHAGEKQITLNGEVSFIRINLMGMNFLLLVFKCSKVFKQGRI